MNRLRSLDHAMVATFERITVAGPDGTTPSPDRDGVLTQVRRVADELVAFIEELADIVEHLNPGHGDRKRLEIVQRIAEAERRLSWGLATAMHFERGDEAPAVNWVLGDIGTALAGAGWNVREAHEILHHGRVLSGGRGWPASGPEPVLDEPTAYTR